MIEKLEDGTITPDSIAITPTGPVRGTIRPPGSKSLTNRALVCAALARGESMLSGALDSEDTRVMIEALRQLGVPVEVDPAARSIKVQGCSGRIPASAADLFVANSGTTVRFLAALLALGHGDFRLDGTPRMRERPIGDLLDALAQLGVSARSEPGSGCPPVVLQARGLAGGQAQVRGDVSSQFLSGLLLAAPYAERPVELLVEGTLVSQPYIRMTLAVMADFGLAVEAANLTRFAVPRGVYQGRTYDIEPDASAASYFFAAAAITGGEVTVEGLSRGSLQGDVAFVDCLAQMGCSVRAEPDRITVTGQSSHHAPRDVPRARLAERDGTMTGQSATLAGIEVDMNAISDTVQTLGAVALFAQGPTTIRGVAHIRHKETDRIAALTTELRKLGAEVEEFADGLRITPKPLRPAAIDTYHDHRMAMSLALVGLRNPGVVINDPRCAEKTYPEFFDDLLRLCGP